MPKAFHGLSEFEWSDVLINGSFSLPLGLRLLLQNSLTHYCNELYNYFALLRGMSPI